MINQRMEEMEKHMETSAKLTTPALAAGGHSSRTSSLHGPKSRCSSNSCPGVLSPTVFRSLPFRNSGIRVSRTRESYAHLPFNMKSPNPDPRGQRSTLLISGIFLSGNRQMRGRETLTFQIPEPRCTDTPPRVSY
jgi:hypothetical protein